MRKFEIVKRFEGSDIKLPQRETKNAVGYDVAVAEDTIIYPYAYLIEELAKHIYEDRTEEEYVEKVDGLLEEGKIEEVQKMDLEHFTCTLEELATYTKRTGIKPTLVPTGIKAKCNEDESIELVLRSSTPLKYWLVMSNSIGIINGEYYGNPSNEGEIFFQLINFSPVPIKLRKGEKIGQIIFKKFLTTDDDHLQDKKTRTGGFGSSDK